MRAPDEERGASPWLVPRSYLSVYLFLRAAS